MKIAKTKCLVFYLLLVFGMAIGPYHAMAAEIIHVASGDVVSTHTLTGVLSSSDVVLLGELHDNPTHHKLRAELLAAVARSGPSGMTIVAEHLPAGSRVVFADTTLPALEAAGFNAASWGWPLHAPLFDAIRNAGLPLVGGNLAKEVSKQIVKNRKQAFPPAVAGIFEAAPLSDAASKKLDQDLIDGHCGQLPQRYLEPMQLAQRATDISMAITLRDNKPAVLVAGNGHVRKDYGVPQVLAAVAPSLKVTSVGFYERTAASAEMLPALAGNYDYVWFTDAIERPDPCENFKLKK